MVDAFVNRWAMDNKASLYNAIALQQMPDGNPTGRGSESTVIAVPGVWLDLDCDRGEAKKRYPPIEVATKFIQDMDPQPSVVVASGARGFHIYHLFDKPLLCANDDDRLYAKKLVAGFQRNIAKQLHDLGEYAIDSTFDLARVLRIVNSRNWGTATVVQPVTGFQPDNLEDWLRYEPATFEEWLPLAQDLALSHSGNPGSTLTHLGSDAATLYMPEDMAIPAKVMALIATDPQFISFWSRKKRLSDASASGFCFGMTRILVLYGCTDDEIAVTILNWRKIHGEDKHDNKEAMRKIGRDLARIRLDESKKKNEHDAKQARALKRQETENVLKVHEPNGSTPKAPISPLTLVSNNGEPKQTGAEMTHEEAVKALCEFTGVEVTYVFKIGDGDDCDFRICFNERENISLGNAGRWYSSPGKLIAGMIDSQHIELSISQKEWKLVRSLIIKAAKFKSQPILDGKRIVRGLLNEYFEENKTEEPELWDCLNERVPFIDKKKESLCVHAGEFVAFCMKRQVLHQLTKKEIVGIIGTLVAGKRRYDTVRHTERRSLMLDVWPLNVIDPAFQVCSDE